MTLQVDLFWSFRSPYSYIVLPRIMALEESHDVEVTMRVVHPGAIRNPSYFPRMDPLARPYFHLDSARSAAFHGLPFARPRPDPIDQDPVTLAVAPHQPLALRLGRLGIAACETGRGIPFCWEVSRLLWGGEHPDWRQEGLLAAAAARAGVEFSTLEERVTQRPASHDAVLERNAEALREAGHWGVPTMVFAGEPFFGQDRFRQLVQRLEECGLERRDHPEPST